MAVLLILNITIFCQACVYLSNRGMARNMFIALETYNSTKITDWLQTWNNIIA